MKKPLVAAIIAFIFVSSSLAETLRLTDGREFVEFKIISETATHVLIRYKGGAAKVEKKLLPAALREKYPESKEEVPASATATEPDKKFVHVGDFDLRSTENGEAYTHYSWIAEIKNPTDRGVSCVVEIKMFDAKKFLLETDIGDAIYVAAGKTVTYSGKSLMKTELWNQVKTYGVNLR